MVLGLEADTLCPWEADPLDESLLVTADAFTTGSDLDDVRETILGAITVMSEMEMFNEFLAPVDYTIHQDYCMMVCSGKDKG